MCYGIPRMGLLKALTWVSVVPNMLIVCTLRANSCNLRTSRLIYSHCKQKQRLIDQPYLLGHLQRRKHFSDQEIE